MTLRTAGIRGLVGQVYTVEDGALALDDSNALIPLTRAANGFYYIMVHINYLTQVANCELKIYESKAKFKRRPSRPYHIVNFRISNQYDETGTLTFADFDTWFSDDATRPATKNEQRRAVEMLKTFTGSSEFEIRNGIVDQDGFSNIPNCTTFTDSTILNAD